MIFGDIALWTGLSADYEASLPDIGRLRDAGIDVYLTVGNHDRREPFFRHHPHQAEITPVRGRAVSVVDLGHADLFLLDTLDELPGDEGTWNNVGADFDNEQADWLVGAAAAAKRPFLVGSHHAPIYEPKFAIGGRPLYEALGGNPFLAGFVYGHLHSWSVTWRMAAWGNPRIVKMACLPSTGWWGTIGFATLRVDMYGHGGSGGEFRKHTLYKWLTNAMTVIDYARTLDFVTELYLCGHSQGGLTVMLAAALKHEAISGIIPMSPAIPIPECARRGILLGGFFDPSHIPEEITSPRGWVLDGNYVRVAQTIHVEEAIDRYDGPVLLVHGGADETIPAQCSLDAAKRYKNAELAVIPGDTHCYDDHLDEAVEAVRRWMAERAPADNL